jgi:acyl carrier protein phosphodiesterase
MNYLAHAYLSFGRPDILVGNMISDHIKGKKQFDYPKAVQKGIRLHRLIDNYTDGHEATRELKSFFRPHYRLYAGAFGDVVYDHFLAKDPNEFVNELDLTQFAVETYDTLEKHKELFPLPFQKMFPYMREYDWLSNYRHRWAIERSFGGVVRRAAYLTESVTAFEIFNKNYEALAHCYDHFFPDLIKYTRGQLDELLQA